MTRMCHGKLLRSTLLIDLPEEQSYLLNAFEHEYTGRCETKMILIAVLALSQHTK